MEYIKDNFDKQQLSDLKFICPGNYYLKLSNSETVFLKKGNEIIFFKNVKNWILCGQFEHESRTIYTEEDIFRIHRELASLREANELYRKQMIVTKYHQAYSEHSLFYDILAICNRCKVQSIRALVDVKTANIEFAITARPEDSVKWCAAKFEQELVNCLPNYFNILVVTPISDRNGTALRPVRTGAAALFTKKNEAALFAETYIRNMVNNRIAEQVAAGGVDCDESRAWVKRRIENELKIIDHVEWCVKAISRNRLNKLAHVKNDSKHRIQCTTTTKKGSALFPAVAKVNNCKD